jgi:hypothetical protein
MDKSMWSPRAHRAHKAASNARKAHEARAKFAYERMREGPYLEGEFVVVPSDWYREEAKGFWNEHTFRFERKDGLPSWVRSTELPFDPGDGKGERKFTPRAWLKWTRARFFGLFGSELNQVGDPVSKDQFIREGLSDKDR